jgi:hypothetical protein
MTRPTETITQLRAACAVGDEALEIERRAHLAAIRARLTAASNGPWFRHATDNGLVEILCRASTSTTYRIATVLRRGRRQREDAELIAHSPADLDWLIAECDRLRDERDLLLQHADEPTVTAYWTLRAERKQQEVQAGRDARAAR